MAILASTQITGTLGVLGQVTVSGITASFQGTATNAVSASYVPNLYPQEYLPSASWASASISASYVPNLYPQEYLASASWASASISASYVPNLYPQEYLASASWASSSISASYSPIPTLVPSASFALTASYLTEISQSIIPAVSNSFDLGSVEKPWQHIYVGPNSLIVGGIPVSVSGSELLVSGSPVATTNIFTDNSVRLYLTASSTSSNSAPLKFSSGPLMLQSEAGAMEFYYDDFYASITTVATPSSYTSVYPPAHNGTFVKATTVNAGDVQPYFATDPAKSLTGGYNNNQWQSTGTVTNRFHIDLGTASIVQRIYIENGHHFGTNTIKGVQNFTFWGSNNNSAFNELTYGTDTNWTQLTTDITQLRQHIAVDAGDPQYVIVNNGDAYRYYCFKIADAFTPGQVTLRRIELQTGNYIGGDRKTIVLTDGQRLPSGFVPVTTTNGRLTASLSMSYSGTTLYTTASVAVSASYVPNLYPQTVQVSASWASASISASYVPNLYPQEYLASASWASASISASYTETASYAPTVTVGLTSTQSWWDAITSLTQSMYIQNGLIVSWSVSP